MVNMIVSIVLMVIVFPGISVADEAHVSIDDNVMCGPNCLWLAARTCNIATSLKRLRYFAKTDPTHATSLKGMLKALEQIGLEPVLINTDWRGLNKIRYPAILLLNQPSNGHYTFLEEIDSEIIRVIDPPNRRTWARKQFMNKFTGYVIVVCKDSEDKQRLKEEFKTKATANFVKRVQVFLTVIFFGGSILLISRPWSTRKSIG